MSVDTRGFEPGQNVVTVRGVVGTAGPIRARVYRPTKAENAPMVLLPTGVLWLKRLKNGSVFAAHACTSGATSLV